MVGWATAAGALFALALLVLHGPLPRAFSDDARVLDRAQALWPLFVAMLPAGGAVFALDGILIGAGDTRFLMWGMVAAAAVFVPLALLSLHEGWGVVGVWAGLDALIAVRLLTCGARFAGGRWALTGARPTRPRAAPRRPPPTPSPAARPTPGRSGTRGRR
jgi:Na+-driven multidrug efflux pump